MSDDDEDEDEDGLALQQQEDKYRPQSLSNMISLIAMLTERSRGEDNQLCLSTRDFNAMVTGKVRSTLC